MAEHQGCGILVLALPRQRRVSNEHQIQPLNSSLIYTNFLPSAPGRVEAKADLAPDLTEFMGVGRN